MPIDDAEFCALPLNDKSKQNTQHKVGKYPDLKIFLHTTKMPPQPSTER